ncbi:MAG: hypothetical protein C4324_02955 [Blastocatellia bacterium]
MSAIESLVVTKYLQNTSEAKASLSHFGNSIAGVIMRFCLLLTTFRKKIRSNYLDENRTSERD